MNTKKRLFEKEESHQAMMQLKSIIANAQELLDKVEVFEEGLDAWVQSYLTKSEDYLEAIKKYVEYGRETTLTPQESTPGGSAQPPQMPGETSEPIMPSIVDFNPTEPNLQPDMMAKPGEATELTPEPIEGQPIEGPTEGPAGGEGPEMVGPEEPEEGPEEIEGELEEEPEEGPEEGPEETEEEPEEEPEEIEEPITDEGPSSRAQLVGGGDAEVGPEDMGPEDIGDEEEIPPMDLMNKRKGEEDEATFDDMDQINADLETVDPEEQEEENEFGDIGDAFTDDEED